MNVTLRALAAASLVVGAFGIAVAKLPPPTPEQKAAAEAKKEKDKEAAEKAKKELSAAEDRAVANYMANMKAKGVTVTPQMGPTSGNGGANANAGANGSGAQGTSGKIAIGPPAGAEKK
jgi:membrane protein involved in colicin uptake